MKAANYGNSPTNDFRWTSSDCQSQTCGEQSRTIEKRKCFEENTVDRHFERAVGESRNLFLNRFLHFTMLSIASVEMTVGLFNKALKPLKHSY